MNHDYPEHVLAREPAPAYSGEGAFALWHYSENPGLGRFRPSTTTAADRERFFGQSDASRIHVIEAGWLARMQQCRLYAYRLPGQTFRPHEVVGYWVSGEQVDAVERVVVDDLPGRHARARIELRVTPSIWPFWRRVTESTVEFSGSRLANAATHADQFG